MAHSQPNPTDAAAPVILIVDDEPDLEQLLSLKFRRRIRKGEIHFYFARDGIDALSKLASHPDIEVVVTDINMPNMDGLALVKNLRTEHPMVKAVIVSAYGDLGNIRGAMNRGAFDFLTKPLDFKDFEATVSKTVEHVRTLRETIKSLEENRILRLFVDEAALHFMQKEEESECHALECSVAFIDICAFTAISERHPPEVVIDLLNRYFEAIVERVKPCGGVIDKFIGDAAMVTFSGEGHRARAVQACLDVKHGVQDLRGIMEERVGFFPNVGIGLNAGNVVVGPVGARSLGRLDFTVIGDVVNTASRLQAAAGPGDIMVTRRFLELLGGGVETTDRGVHSLRGKAEPMHLHSITAFHGDEGESAA